MLDVIFISTTLIFVVVAIAYVEACGRLGRRKS